MLIGDNRKVAAGGTTDVVTTVGAVNGAVNRIHIHMAFSNVAALEIPSLQRKSPNR